MPNAMQDDIARVVLLLASGEQPVVELTPDDIASFATSLEQVKNHQFATDEQVRDVWAKHGLWGVAT